MDIWGPIATEKTLQANDCGNPAIDNLARIRTMQDVWFRLEYLFPGCKSLSYRIWLMRKSGEMQMDVRDSQSFKLEDMPLTTQCAVQILNIGEYRLTEISLRDALRRGGMHLHTSDNFFSEGNEVLDQAIVHAVNAYYKHSKYATSEVKIVTRAGDNNARVALGIPSAKYQLLTHECAIEQIVNKIPSHLHPARIRLFPEFLEVAFTDTMHTPKDAVGEIVQVGINCLNSQGTRTRALIAAAFCLRTICSNGSTAKDSLFSIKYPHRGNILNGNNEFAQKTSEILKKLAVMMERLPQLAKIPINDKLLGNIQTQLNDILGVKESRHCIENIAKSSFSVIDVWNTLTHLPHHISNAERKMQLEQLGFQILSNHLYHKN